ncbi:MAG: hypothetical protein CSA95_05705 [Bacteroidetes bacterium]|nr:MAG: hypothetical protein CSA95_05705 [Bacteroidota bacterium]
MRSSDMIGAYQLYRAYEKIHDVGPSYFQLFSTYNDFNFEVDASQFIAAEMIQHEDFITTSYTIAKKDFSINIEDFDLKGIRIKDMLYKDYSKKRIPERIDPFYASREFTASDYLLVYRELLQGLGSLSPQYDLLLKEKNTFAQSLRPSQDDAMLRTHCDSIAADAAQHRGIVQQILYAELVTDAPTERKQGYYNAFLRALMPPQTLWEDMVAFCGEAISGESLTTSPTLFEAVGRFPGAINPHAIALHNERGEWYEKAEKAFSKEHIKQTLAHLEKSVNQEGINLRTLNLIGAAYRFTHQPERAMPYLILAYLIDPEAPFVSGNMALCLSEMGYDRTGEFVGFLHKNAPVDAWSKAQFDTLIK